jgi:acyl-CoA hydrolase
VKQLLDALRPGLNVYVQGGTGEAVAFCDALKAEPDRATGVHFISGLIPGMNTFDYASLTPTTTLTTFMPTEAIRASMEAGRVNLPPLGYSQMAAWFRDEAEVDLAVLHLSPDVKGEASYGIAADFGPLVASHAKQLCAIVNPHMPRMPRGHVVHLRECEFVIEAPRALIGAAEGAPSEDLLKIGHFIAPLVPDGAAIQTGVGGAPAATLALLKDRRNLRIRSGMITEGYRALAEAGAWASDPVEHITGLAYGTDDFYAYAADRNLCRFADASETHGAHLGDLEKLISINSALDIDLFGQVNIEWRAGKLVSAMGGAADFNRAARRSKGGRAIIALQATAGGGKISRIVPRLESPTVSLPRHDVDTVVTEYGVAELAGKTTRARAEALIAIAAPQFRAELEEAVRKM